MKNIIMLVPLLLLFACASTPVDTTQEDNYFNEHKRLTESLPKTSEIVSPGEKFQVLMADFKNTLTEENLRATYADDVYFNDTFTTLNGIDEVVEYLTKTVTMMESAQVTILDVAKSDSDYYLRWQMDMEFYARKKKIRTRSIGITQIRFNAKGKVIYHQDFWDSSNAFYQHLPIIGGLVKRVKNSMH